MRLLTMHSAYPLNSPTCPLITCETRSHIIEPTLSILIKALNEEAKIARCLESACRAISEIKGEIILVDSISTDKTVEIAKKYPVRIVQFENKCDIGCGAAVQLGYQHSKGKYVYVLDGDMELSSDFLHSAIDFLETHNDVAGVGGRLVDTSFNTPADLRRHQYYAKLSKPIYVDHLAGGGLYRRDAIETVGYIANRWLMAAEELELGLRLTSCGWKLVRMPNIAVIHTGHNESASSMVMRLYRNGRMAAYGKLLRYAVGTPWFFRALLKTWFTIAAPFIYLLSGVLTLVLLQYIDSHAGVVFLLVFCITLCSALLLLMVKKRDFYQCVISIAAWHLYAYAATKAFFCKTKDPKRPISSILLA